MTGKIAYYTIIYFIHKNQKAFGECTSIIECVPARHFEPRGGGKYMIFKPSDSFNNRARNLNCNCTFGCC